MGIGEFFSNGILIILTALIAAVVVVFFMLYKNSAQRNNSSFENKRDDGNICKGSIGEPDENLVAVLTAAVLASMGIEPEYKIRVKSFRRIPQSSPIWNIAGRTDNVTDGLN